MSNLQVLTVGFIVVICLFVTVTEVEGGYKYSSIAHLRTAVIFQCCGRGKRGIDDRIPLTQASEAKRFLTRFTTRSLHTECCEENCDNEEVHEGSDSTPVELGEECLVEGCDTEEIEEHC